MSKPVKPYRKLSVGNHALSPETLMMSYGFDPKLSENSIKAPVFLASTFAFDTAEDGAAFFRVMSGKRRAGDPEAAGLMYSRFNNPNVEVLEDRLTLFDGAEESLVFSSGMAAISTSLLAHAKSGSVILHSSPLYGATENFIRKYMPSVGVKSVEFFASAGKDELAKAAEQAMAAGKVSVIYTETPTNPTNNLVDLVACVELAGIIEKKQGSRPVVMTDNTFLGPIGQTPIGLGVDIVIYSLTKYVGGHSDLIAGGALGSTVALAPVRALRSMIGTNLDPHTAWMLMRSLETVKLRMSASFENARSVAEFLRDHPKVDNVRYLGFLEAGSRDAKVHAQQSTGDGSTFAFDVEGGEAGAFRMLNALQVVKLAVSLGGTESLICHPGSTTHAAVDEDLRERLGFTPGLVRMSVGLENPKDLIADLAQALDAV